MKRVILSIIGIIYSSLFLTPNVFSAECSQSCTIKDEPAPILQEYIEINRKVISNIQSELSQTEKVSPSKIQKLWNQTWNSVTNWTEFENGVEFFKLDMLGEVPRPIKRDLQLLEDESKYISQFLSKTITGGYNASEITGACSGIENCSLSGTAGSVIRGVLQNHLKVIRYYRLSILGREGELVTPIQFVPNNFKSEFNNSYNKYSISDCSKCDGEFQDLSTKTIVKFSKQIKYIKNGWQDWKDAADMLRGAFDPSVEQDLLNERKILSEELGNQGISGTNGEAVLKNLDDFNNIGYSSQNNPVNNSFSTFKNSVDTTGSKQVLSSFKHTVKQIYSNFSDYFNPDEEKQIPISAISSVEYNIENSLNIINEIDTLYQRELPFTATQNLNSDKLQARMLDMHIDLSEAIKKLDETKPFSEKVCNDQDRGNGKCKY